MSKPQLHRTGSNSSIISNLSTSSSRLPESTRIIPSQSKVISMTNTSTSSLGSEAIKSETNFSESSVKGKDRNNSTATENTDTTDATKRRKSLATILSQQRYVGHHSVARIRPTEDIFNPDDPQIKEDIIRMILQYLSNEGFTASRMVVQDEANIKIHERQERTIDARKLRKAIIDGDWPEVEKLYESSMAHYHKENHKKAFLYAMYKQQYLEYIDNHEISKALTLLTKRLKPLEHHEATSNEFKDLCYLLTAKSVTDAPSFRNWEGIATAREKLVERLMAITNIDMDIFERTGSTYVPPNRLLTLLRQAVAYQVEFSRYHPKVALAVDSLLEDYSPFIIPNAVGAVLRGHTGNVKCVEFVGEEGREIISGSSDNTIRIWDVESSECVGKLNGHTSRIWDISSTKKGEFVASASGDETVKLWDLRQSEVVCANTFTGHSGDVYAVRYHPNEKHIATAGYDKMVRIFDLTTGQVIKTFSGHELAIPKITFSPLGNLVVSGSKDNTIKFWDVVSGICIRTLTHHLGEVTSVDFNTNGTLLLSSSKDNSNRLWDVRMQRTLRKLKGHQNTTKNFITSRFVGRGLITGGSEDGSVYIWDGETGEVVQKLRGHTAEVYSAIWSNTQSIFVSCSNDWDVRTWRYDENIPHDLSK